MGREVAVDERRVDASGTDTVATDAVGDVVKTTGRDPLVIYRLFASLVRDGFVEVPEGGRANAPDEQSDSEWSPEALGL